MIKQKFFLFFMVLFSISAIACVTHENEKAGSPAIQGTQTLPSRFTLVLPASLEAMSNAENSLLLKRTRSSSSDGLWLLQALLEIRKDALIVSAVMFIFADELITGLSPSNGIISGKVIVLTPDLALKVKAVVPEVDLNDLPYGESFEFPPFAYDIVSGNPKYDLKFEVLDSTSSQDKIAIHWSGNKKRTKVAFQGRSTQVKNAVIFAFDDEKKTMKIPVINPDMSMLLSVKEDMAAVQSRGLYIYFYVKTALVSFSASGYADDLGGVFLTDSTYISANSLFFEEFDAAGNVIFMKHSHDKGANWQNISGSSSGKYDFSLSNYESQAKGELEDIGEFPEIFQ